MRLIDIPHNTFCVTEDYRSGPPVLMFRVEEPRFITTFSDGRQVKVLAYIVAPARYAGQPVYSELLSAHPVTPPREFAHPNVADLRAMLGNPPRMVLTDRRPGDLSLMEGGHIVLTLRTPEPLRYKTYEGRWRGPLGGFALMLASRSTSASIGHMVASPNMHDVLPLPAEFVVQDVPEQYPWQWESVRPPEESALRRAVVEPGAVPSPARFDRMWVDESAHFDPDAPAAVIRANPRVTFSESASELLRHIEEARAMLDAQPVPTTGRTVFLPDTNTPEIASQQPQSPDPDASQQETP